jgi:hypothetical protein
MRDQQLFRECTDDLVGALAAIGFLEAPLKRQGRYGVAGLIAKNSRKLQVGGNRSPPLRGEARPFDAGYLVGALDPNILARKSSHGDAIT